MSCLCMPMPKKLKQLPSSTKKAWDSFTSSLHPKIRSLHNNLKLPKSITKTTRRLLNLRPKRRPFLSQSRRQPRGFDYNMKYQFHHLQHSSACNSPSVYVGRLYGHSPSSSQQAKIDLSMGEASTSSGASRSTVDGRNVTNVHTVKRRKKKVVGSNNCNKENTRDVKWKEYVSSLPSIRGVDEKAEEFISKFRQEMQLQREQSLLNFQEMLARTA